MTQTEKFRGVPGMLRPFKEFIEASGLKSGDQVVYYGVPGTCTPFVELLAFAIRSLGLEQVFIPLVDEGKARTLRQVPDVGMQTGDAPPCPGPEGDRRDGRPLDAQRVGGGRADADGHR